MHGGNPTLAFWSAQARIVKGGFGMANGLTSSTPEDASIQGRRLGRAQTKRAKECVGWSIGRGYEADYLEAIQVSDGFRYRRWLQAVAYFRRGPR